jgi:hypothetical protein
MNKTHGNSFNTNVKLNTYTMYQLNNEDNLPLLNLQVGNNMDPEKHRMQMKEQLKEYIDQ